MLSEKKPLVRFAKSSRTFHPKRARATVNSANSTNCVIPKRVVDRLDAASRRAMGGAKDEQKKSRCEGCGRSNLQGKEREEDACTRHTSFSLRPAQYREPFPPSWQLCHVAATTKRRDSSPPFPFFLYPGLTRCNTQHLHTILISYLSIVRSVCASLHAHECTFRRVYRVNW